MRAAAGELVDGVVRDQCEISAGSVRDRRKVWDEETKLRAANVKLCEFMALSGR